MTAHVMLDRLPLVGRGEELGLLRALLGRAARGAGGAAVIAGPGGIGKSRLAQAFLQEARLRGCTVASGQAYAAEQGVPFAPVSDAFGPVLRALPPDELRPLVRNIEQEVAQLFPTSLPHAPASDGPGVESPAQLPWALAELTRRLADVRPLVVLIEDLQWADGASREMLHFLVRHTRDAGVALVMTVNDSDAAAQSLLASLDQSLGRVGFMESLRLVPLSEVQTRELVCSAFRVDESVAGDFCAELYARTRGNPFFIDEIVKSLVLGGALTRRSGTWAGWDALRFEPPRTVRDAVRLRCASLSPGATELAQLIAVFGTRVRYDVLHSVAAQPEEALVRSIDELCGRAVLDESTADGEPVYDIRHPLVREVLYDDTGHARRRLLHARIADALEARYGAEAELHADQLARHFLHGGTAHEPRAIPYLQAAGRAALRRHAYGAAAEYLAAAIAATAGDDPRVPVLLEDHARARLRMGELDRGHALLAAARTAAAGHDARETVGRLWWRTGLAHYWSGAHEKALDALDQGRAAIGDDAPALACRLQIARATCLQTLGHSDAAARALEDAHALATASTDPSLLARAERALLQFHIWTGPPEQAHAHGQRALELARTTKDRHLECTVHWAFGVLHGMTGNAPACRQAIETSGRLAEELGSPFLRAASLELLIEYCYGSGEWDTGLAVGERAIALARNLQLRSLLPRVLVWTALIRIGRDELDSARAYVEEAARVAHADDDRGARDVHASVPVAIGRTCLLLATGEYDRAIDVGLRALALVDRTGYRAWAVHRLLPFLAEAHLQQHQVAECRPFAARLRAEASRLHHELGLAWADACDGLMKWLGGDPVGAAVLLREAAERLEAVPYVYDAARVRRQLAGRLADAGDRDAAVRELRRVHDVLVRLGANRELEKARGQFREVSARPQPRTAVPGSGTLTERELEIARMIAARQSNKAIARRLGVSPRTVGTHVSNIYRKLELGSREDLASWVRATLA